MATGKPPRDSKVSGEGSGRFLAVRGSSWRTKMGKPPRDSKVGDRDLGVSWLILADGDGEAAKEFKGQW